MHPQVFISSSAVAAKHPLEALENLLPITTNIELTGGCSYDPELLQKLIDFKNNNPVSLLLHSYFPPPQEHFVLNFADTEDRTRDFISRSMEFVNALDVPYYSIHAGFRKDFLSDRHGILHKASDKMFTLDGIGENTTWFRTKWPNTPLVLENIYPNGGDTSCGFMMSCDEICQALDAIPDIFLLLDLGHLKVSANLMGFDLEESADNLFQHYGHRIKELHLSENNGLKDDHIAISKKSTQYACINKYAHLINKYGINLTLEARVSALNLAQFSYRLVVSALADHQIKIKDIDA